MLFFKFFPSEYWTEQYKTILNLLAMQKQVVDQMCPAGQFGDS